MANGNFMSNSSSSSILARSFLTASGIDKVISNQIVGPNKREQLIKKYSNKVRSYASRIPSWKPFADGLAVHIDEKGSVSVNFNGSANDRQIVELLEFGTPSTAPESVIRVMEAELHQEYILDTSGETL